ncbi:hypothetical protein BDY19DRAFT_935381 [Irpex rosettiformis]|uniref:Uncharacterized protein n=1 Tax=Irpex rosettiformis TaxID=378272 RepID=A0ACB8UAU5_9APHY|nr:hypothetical protein BDY19DRAFT_935381 [Irpex rosettiformis]
MPSWVVTGASRGLGYEFVKQISQDPSNVVIGLVRNRTTSLSALLELEKTRKNLHIVEADVTNDIALEKAVGEVKKFTGGTLDTLVNNAALSSQERSGYELDGYPNDEKELLEQDLLANFKTNVIGVIKVINSLLPLIRATATASGSARVITLNSGLGDVDMTIKSEVTFGGPYSISKAALLLAIAKYAVKYKKENIIFLSISPGLVDTATEPPTPETLEAYAHMVKTFQIGYPNWNGVPITPEESVSAMLNVLKGLTINDTGAFISHKGNKEWL